LPDSENLPTAPASPARSVAPPSVASSSTRNRPLVNFSGNIRGISPLMAAVSGTAATWAAACDKPTGGRSPTCFLALAFFTPAAADLSAADNFNCYNY